MSVTSRWRRVASRRFTRRALRVALVAVVGLFLVRPLVPRIVAAADRLDDVHAGLAVVGFGLQVLALCCYSVMTHAALERERDAIGLGRLLRIQLVSRAVSSGVPGGAAAGPAVAYRLMTTSGVSGHGATASLASGSVVSAVVLNVMLWTALIVSIPMYGFNALYAGVALVGIVLMLAVALVFVAVVDGSAMVERPVRAVTVRLRRLGLDVDGERAMASMRGFGHRVEGLFADRPLVGRLSVWALANWLLDAASLWVFLRSFGVSMSPVGLLVAFGVANVAAAIPISPGGIGVVEWAYLSILVTFGATLEQATIAVVTYRLAQFVFPIVLGGLASVSLTLESRLARRLPVTPT